ncbi:MAG: hypothetical protein K6A45_07595 [Lachnospiraceae bacterium]|nr:hypothetical protein [Lachnospiraceae bacterium]
MLSIETITSILQVVLIVLVLGAAAVFLYAKFGRKGKKGASSSSDDTVQKGGKTFPVEDFIPVQEIRNGIVKLDGEDRFIASINCKGFDFFTSSEEEILSTQRAYYGFINTIQSPITMRIDSTALDLTSQIRTFQKIKQERLDERNLKYSQFIEFRAKLKNVANEDAQRDIENVLYSLSRQINVCTNKIRHLDSLIAYELRLSGRNANPLQEERYIVDWEFKPQDFPEGITENEIYAKAVKTLDNKIQQMRHALGKANVKCSRDSDKELFALNYRHFHPLGGDLYKNFDGSNSDDRLVSGLVDYEGAMKKYEKIKESEEWKRIEARQEALAAEAENIELPDNIDDEDDEDVLIGSGADTKKAEDYVDEGSVTF